MLHSYDAGSVLMFELYIASTTVTQCMLHVASCHNIIGSKSGCCLGKCQMVIPQQLNSYYAANQFPPNK